MAKAITLAIYHFAGHSERHSSLFGCSRSSVLSGRILFGDREAQQRSLVDALFRFESAKFQERAACQHAHRSSLTISTDRQLQQQQQAAGLVSFYSAGALVYFHAATQMRADPSLASKSTAHLKGARRGRRAVAAQDQRVSGSSRTTEGCLRSSFRLCYPALCGFVFRMLRASL